MDILYVCMYISFIYIYITYISLILLILYNLYYLYLYRERDSYINMLYLLYTYVYV